MRDKLVTGVQTCALPIYIGTDRLVERGAEASVGHHAQLPRKAASLDAAVVRRRIRRPTEPGSDREVRGGNGNRRSRDTVSPFGEVSPYAVFREEGRTPELPLIDYLGWRLLFSNRNERLHGVP